MTAKRDLKRRIRERQDRTGESYVTARRHVIADAPAPAPAPVVGSGRAMEVVEMIDVSADAAGLGLRCRVVISTNLAERADTQTVLAKLRDVFVGTAGDPVAAPMGDFALRGHLARQRIARLRSFEHSRRFFQRARAGLGGMSEDGAMLALPVTGRDGMLLVLCTIWRNDPSLMLTAFDELGDEGPEREQPGQATAAASSRSTLYLIFDGKRHVITKSEFVIGRNKGADLQIRDGNLSRRHASVIWRNEQFYFKDLGSTHGLLYMGLRIDNKRIDEGDVFHLGACEVRFTYLVSD